MGGPRGWSRNVVNFCRQAADRSRSVALTGARSERADEQQDRSHRHRLRRPHHRRLLRHLGHDVVCADIVPEKVERAQPGRGADPRGRPRRARARGPRSPAGCRSCSGAEDAVADAEFVYLCVPTPQGADGSADLHLHRGGRPRDRPVPAARGGRHQQVDRAGRLDPGGRAGPRPRRRVRGVEPRVPPRGLGRRTTSSTPTASSSAPTTRPPPSAWPRSTSASPAPLHGHRPGVGRDHQVRQQRLPRHQDLASSTPSPRCARPSAPTSTTSCSAWATTSASATSSSGPGPGGAAAASRRTRARWCASPRTPATTSSCSRA